MSSSQREQFKDAESFVTYSLQTPRWTRQDDRFTGYRTPHWPI